MPSRYFFVAPVFLEAKWLNIIFSEAICEATSLNHIEKDSSRSSSDRGILMNRTLGLLFWGNIDLFPCSLGEEGASTVSNGAPGGV